MTQQVKRDAVPVPIKAIILGAVRYPVAVVSLGILLILLGAAAMSQLVKDTRADAFLSDDNPALIYRDLVKEQFGLSDPMVVAIASSAAQGIYQPEVLQLISTLSDALGSLPNVDTPRVVSLATEKNITTSDDDIEIQPFLDPLPRSAEEALAVREALKEFPLYIGNIVDEQGTMALIVLELLDESLYEQTYAETLDLLQHVQKPGHVELHVAGEGAIAGYLSSYIDTDARRLNPLAWLIIMLIMVLAYRRLSPALLANVIIAASVGGALGIMALAGIPFYMITTALPVILIGISVADTIHIYSHYFELQAIRPGSSSKDLARSTMEGMWRPVTLTSLTTMAGFIGLYLAAYMPPFRYFGLFAAVGVFVAWIYSMALLPAALTLWPPKNSKFFRRRAGQAESGVFNAVMRSLGGVTLSHPRKIISLFVILGAGCLYIASSVVVNDEAITIFHPSEPIYKADKIINKHMNGTYPLDIVIETAAPEGLLLPENLRKMESLQKFTLTLPHVGGVTSIVDYLKQMNKVITGGGDETYELPGDQQLAAQYLLLYSATSDPTDFEEEIDYDYRMANIRVNVNSGSSRDFTVIVESLQNYIDSEFTDESIKATLSGRVNLNYHWIKDLLRSHISGLLAALVLVWLVSAVLFRSLVAGIFTLIPVCGSVLVVYATMVLWGITLNVGTSMFAAVAIGLGVDFSIHTLDRLRDLFSRYGEDIDSAYGKFYQTTGVALLLNFLAIACGFGVLLISKVASLNNFGGIVAISIAASFIFSMTLLPALVKAFQPKFIYSPFQSGGFGK